ncbi:MAG: hypothetical protein ABI286_07505 [Edaphobacter sp.]
MNTTVPLPEDPAAAVKVTCCVAPGYNVVDVGKTVAPAGSPAILTATGDVKPLAEVTESVTVCDVPAITVRAPGTLMEKLGGPMTLTAALEECVNVPL